MPKQPATWEKYKMSYVQSKAEGYFTDQYVVTPHYNFGRFDRDRAGF
jgi:hypothetical protein